MRTFFMDIAGHVYRGAWKAVGTDFLNVQCDCGNRTVSLNGKFPEDIARQTLEIMIHGLEDRPRYFASRQLFSGGLGGETP